VKTAIAIQHVAFEDAGVFEDVLYEDGWNVRYLQASCCWSWAGPSALMRRRTTLS